MTGPEKVSLWLAQARGASQASLVARAAILLAGVIALVIPGLQPWDQMDLIPLLGAPLLLVCVVLPDSTAALVFIAVACGGWLLRAPGEITWAVAVTGIALLVVHLASAFAAQVPSYARVNRRALRRWLLPATVALLLVPAVAIAAALVRGAAVPGSLLVTLAALLAATGAVWFAAGQSAGR